ncbi:Rab3 GTPase-activating protein non-catalytic subunit [Harpegnathos saltator]|uniref:Rab3 GTPase-activating protein non-catalytic subunit n=1 Tax=Harpegnathos saltator TaxID=610380 RepID=E2BXV6_HARSA|nr:Rab3 GTPase-activating protein non-catalytic subunit [Harpegnathos saltator]
MSCQIKGIANIPDINNIKKLLYGDAINKSKWDSQELEEVKNKFHITWHGEVVKEQNEWITSVICLPLISLGKASGPDWTCITIGYNTGFVRFYTETGAMLLEEQIHNESILGIKCQSSCSVKHGDVGYNEEIYILYNSGVCILQGFPLFSTLRACRNHLARVQAKCDDLPPITNLSYKKWAFKNQDISNDSEVIGTTSINSFDHLMTASICGGYNATYRSSAPQHNLVLATGKRPFVGFHYALEGGNAPVLSDVAIAMASKLASAIGTAVPWFRSSSKTATSEATSKSNIHESIETMTCRFGLSDIMREGDCITCSPNKVLSVISDAMGRVILINNKKGIAVRMWKGYRDAQCGWIEVNEEKDRGIHKNINRPMQKTLLRTTMFLVIYAPKKGVIDIWSIQQGPKITTFTASKNGRLLYINYGFLGMANNTTVYKNKAQYSCVFMDPLGGLKEICVPFYFALNSKNGKRARDIHLLRKLKTFLREEEFDEEKLISEVTNICLELKTNEIKIQTIEVLMNSKHVLPDVLLAATNYFATQSQEEEEGEKLEVTIKILHQLTTQLQRMITFYKYVKSLLDTAPEYDIVTAGGAPNVKNLSSTLLTSEREIYRIIKLAKTLNSFEDANVSTESKVKFKEDERAFFYFLSCFEFGDLKLISLRKDLKEEKIHEIARLIYQGWMYCNDVKEKWQQAAEDSNIQPFIFMQLALIYWTHKKEITISEIELKRFTQLLHVICLLTDVEEICTEYNEASLWWKNVRAILTESTKPFNALIAALACRAIAIMIEIHKEKLQNQKSLGILGDEVEDIKNGNNKIKMDEMESKIYDITPDDETYSSISEWENVSKDTCQFTLLIGNLEDITVLNAVVNQQFIPDQTTQFFALPFTKCDISLSLIISKGKDKITLLKRHFPYSLTSSVLLANLCWEFAMSWNKDVTQLESLAAAVAVLRQIPMKHMKHGVCCLLWTLHIKKRIEAVAKLMNKLGKLPKERLCMQDIGLSDIQVTTFLQHSITFLDIFLDAEILERSDSAMIKFEELWEGHPSGPQPFATLAISQTPAWYELILLHVQVVNILYIMACLNLKMLKPLNNLFESVVQPYFFQDITDKAMLTWYRDDKRDTTRTEFLCKVITASMEFIHRETSDGTTVSSTQAISWMGKCQTLASIWKINNDELRIHQVCQLYINGFDRLAEENVPEIIFTNCSNDDIVELIRRVSVHLPKSHCDYHLAELMLDATFIFQDSH